MMIKKMEINKKTMSTIVVCSEKERIQNFGEDSYSYSFNVDSIGYIAVYDGCGGMGARKYLKVGNKTGARIASKLAAYITDEFYNNQQFKFDNSDAERLKKIFQDSFKKVKLGIENDSCLMLGGDLFKSIPTTASIVSIKNNDSDSIVCEYIWAGDSRGYFLDGDGLCQITKDDLQTEEDAFTNLRSDGRLSNVINADGDFELHERLIELKLPTMIITSTDGSFGYYSTPMNFEYIILKSLMEATNENQWKNSLSKLIIPVTGDDFSICIAVYGFYNFNECKKYFKKRFAYIKKIYIDKIDENTTENELKELWEIYKQSYYRW